MVLVTGGSRGIGHAVVQSLCRTGSKVHFTFLRDEAAGLKVLIGLPEA